MRFYLRKEAASDVAEKPESLTEDSYTDLRRQYRAISRTNRKMRGKQMTVKQ